jgi:hypothetical protein
MSTRRELLSASADFNNLATNRSLVYRQQQYWPSIMRVARFSITLVLDGTRRTRQAYLGISLDAAKRFDTMVPSDQTILAPT